MRLSYININLLNPAYILRLLQFKSHVHDNKSRISEAHPTLSKCKLPLIWKEKNLPNAEIRWVFDSPNVDFDDNIIGIFIDSYGLQYSMEHMQLVIFKNKVYILKEKYFQKYFSIL